METILLTKALLSDIEVVFKNKESYQMPVKQQESLKVVDKFTAVINQFGYPSNLFPANNLQLYIKNFRVLDKIAIKSKVWEMMSFHDKIMRSSIQKL